MEKEFVQCMTRDNKSLTKPAFNFEEGGTDGFSFKELYVKIGITGLKRLPIATPRRTCYLTVIGFYLTIICPTRDFLFALKIYFDNVFF